MLIVIFKNYRKLVIHMRILFINNSAILKQLMSNFIVVAYLNKYIIDIQICHSTLKIQANTDRQSWTEVFWKYKITH